MRGYFRGKNIIDLQRPINLSTIVLPIKRREAYVHTYVCIPVVSIICSTEVDYILSLSRQSRGSSFQESITHPDLVRVSLWYEIVCYVSNTTQKILLNSPFLLVITGK